MLPSQEDPQGPAPGVGGARVGGCNEVSSQGSDDALHARIDLVSVVGPRVRLELRTDHSETLVQAELSKHRFRELGLLQGGDAWIRPVSSRVFLDDSELQAI
ncbi:TOBE-like domain protein [Pseudomonas saudimassiliensis]|uniref:TOBE-like domain protein n=1 Tax=Pseudomonas saudimassiliensis TaxID=1461581 RepID=A0A078MF65_9PSED|nr:TOBE-like domain-containing protein [Pseudomonas saudimassiliensis]CEA05953.1 TOBE-like domain protein [Pseudomonas saudimassiliensis]CEF27410.1 TOBE-like domain protein [Pseudomonas saudimassiliensis]